MFTWIKKNFGSKKCDRCSDQTLSDVPVGQSVRIECLRGEDGVCQRLREMGFCESATVEKIADSGALICKVCDAKVAISKGLAQSIIVKDICHSKE